MLYVPKTEHRFGTCDPVSLFTLMLLFKTLNPHLAACLLVISGVLVGVGGIL